MPDRPTLWTVRAARHYEMSKQEFFVVYDQKGRKNLSAEYVSGFSHTLYTTDPTAARHLDCWWLQKSLDEPQTEELDGRMRIVCCGELRVAILPPGVNLRRKTAEPLSVDVVVIGGGMRVYYEDLTRLFRFDEVVLACRSIHRRCRCAPDFFPTRSGRYKQRVVAAACRSTPAASVLP